ncbi:hypothetical protein TWF718_005177 [Orbilia javanica]|uniref:Uncharacterized protein n=1 Tax=Orbilia javanica TaxID=47235 RepID=A0AAN8RLN2_9PEZI
MHKNRQRKTRLNPLYGLRLALSVPLVLLTTINFANAVPHTVPSAITTTSSTSTSTSTSNSTVKDAPEFTNWPPPAIFPRGLSSEEAYGPPSPEFRPEIHIDMLCVPAGGFEIDPSSGDCKIDTFCTPVEPGNQHVGISHKTHSGTPTHRLAGRYIGPRQDQTETVYAITLPGPTISVYFPAGTFPPSHPSHPFYPNGAHPWYESSSPPSAELVPAPVPVPVPVPVPGPAFNPNTLTPNTQNLGIPRQRNPFHPSPANPFQKPCQIPKVYEGICYPLVIPSVVITTYLLATYILYSGDPSKPIPPVYQPPPSPPPHVPYYYRRQNGRYFYPPVATVGQNIRNNLLCLVNFFCGETPPPQPPHLTPRSTRANIRNNEMERVNHSACYFLTSILTYGAGLVILGSFLGGLCNCVKSECEFK